MGWPWDCGLGLGQLALALSVLALLTSLASIQRTIVFVPFVYASVFPFFHPSIPKHC